MNGKKAKELRKHAKMIYDVPTQYDDVRYAQDPEQPDHFMTGALHKRTMKEGCTRKMYKAFKRGYKS